MRIAHLIPRTVRHALKDIYGNLLTYAGAGHYCPVCERSSWSFTSFGREPREGAMCVLCRSLERHRLLWLFLKQRPELMRGSTIELLHVAPEICLTDRLRRMAGPGYLSADLSSPVAMERIDICDIQRPDASFDAIYCSHVLEHVADDRKAMREFHRVLRHDGWAIVMVPTYPGTTFEDASIVTEAGRLAAFGQEDHVRRYGHDFTDRLAEAGFQVAVFKPGDIASPEEIDLMGLTWAAGEIYFCTKEASRS